MTSPDRIHARRLALTTLDRQYLLRRAEGSTSEVVRQLVGMQAQAADAPYLGLWSRLEGFALDDLTDLVTLREVVRGSLLRGTQHVALADDYVWLRPLIAPTLARTQRAGWGRVMGDVDLTELARLAREHLAGEQLTRPQLRDRLAVRWPDVHADALGWSAQALVAVVHPPPHGTWRRGGATPFTLAESYLGRALDDRPDPRELVRRYLTGYGPATARDVQAWSGVRGLGEVIDTMGNELRRYVVDGVELVDLADLPLVNDEATPPVRLLPEFDNLMVAFADRSRLMTDAARARVSIGAMVFPTVLVDGRVVALWKLERGADRTVLTVDPLEPLAASTRHEIRDEAERMLAFAAADAERLDVRID
ncbi:winged helix DNA-binding protein [Diaminobutyricimonas aerilata]|uniref:Winged helix DNA-binding protein n=1 Tax=Diaminobutyricimonas aerilata TaxID=1162967 RepID=A0A2M9CNM7_9MICO|nr:winged helix DNA-binding domain-containing protein [Diaminobutyricimonas aerilata]PJJ73496.1 winged helix DNA-binding protein [Diaminobutyricimonas aerilata]